MNVSTPHYHIKNKIAAKLHDWPTQLCYIFGSLPANSRPDSSNVA